LKEILKIPGNAKSDMVPVTDRYAGYDKLKVYPGRNAGPLPETATVRQETRSAAKPETRLPLKTGNRSFPQYLRSA